MIPLDESTAEPIPPENPDDPGLDPAKPDVPIRKWWQNERIARSSYFLIAVLFHLILFLIIATVVIWKATSPPPTEIFQAASVKVPHPPPQPPSSGATAFNSQFEPQATVVPVVTPLSVMSTQNSAFKVDTSKALHEALSHLALAAPQGSGLGSSGGNGDAGVGSDYGSAKGQGDGFVGTMYDLKQTPDGKPTDMAENAVELTSTIDPAWQTAPGKMNQVRLLRNFVVGWDMSLLEDYYKAPTTLTTTQFCILQKPSEDAPKAFNSAGTIRGRRWIIVYRAKVIPPESGKFRFIGFGDDFLVVRVDGRNVLDGSFPDLGEGLDQGANDKEDVGGTAHYVAYHCGSWVDMNAGIPMDMQVLIGEGPGGESGFILMIQKQGDGSPKGDYPIFQLRDAPIPDADSLIPPSKKKMLFQVAH